eukprot:SAG22_NODE_18567_length_285_cov_0.784946_1_plen_38_part_01
MLFVACLIALGTHRSIDPDVLAVDHRAVQLECRLNRVQ